PFPAGESRDDAGGDSTDEEIMKLDEERQVSVSRFTLSAPRSVASDIGLKSVPLRLHCTAKTSLCRAIKHEPLLN
ncbi:MAG: hypothetical protein AAF149_24360, partial [Bacteroidota bacterium]